MRVSLHGNPLFIIDAVRKVPLAIMIDLRRAVTLLGVLLLVVGCAPAGGATPTPPSSKSPSSNSPSPSPTRSSPEPSRSTTRDPEPTPSLPVTFEVASPLIDGGAATVVAKLHELSGLRPALKLDISEEEVTLVVLDRDKTARAYRWRDGIIGAAETDVQYLRQTIFWPTDFPLDNVHVIFDNAALLGTSSTGQNLQVVEYSPGRVLMSVTTTPESSTIFYRPDGSVFRGLGTTSVADIREGIAAVAQGTSRVYTLGFAAEVGYFSELPVSDGVIERRSRVANRPTYSSQRTATSALQPFDPDLVDPTALTQTISSHDTGTGCAVEIDNRFDRVQPVVTYQCAGETYHSDLKGRDLTAQLR